MNNHLTNHLSADQMARWILGRVSPEENAHARNCPQCSRALSGFRDAVGAFKTAMKDWSALEAVPALERRANAFAPWMPWLQPSLRWVLAGMAAVAVVILPVYSSRELEKKAHQDALLMDEVAAHLSRPLPMSMERVMLLLPSSADETVNPESEEVR
jgi:hypothetical protein